MQRTGTVHASTGAGDGNTNTNTNTTGSAPSFAEEPPSKIVSTLQNNVIRAIRLSLERVPKALLKLPSPLEVSDALEKRRVAVSKDIGFDPTDHLLLWENQRYLPGYATPLISVGSLIGLR